MPLHAVKTENDALLSMEELHAALREVGEQRYHHKHPFHLLMHEGKLSRGQLQAWALNRPAAGTLLTCRMSRSNPNLIISGLAFASPSLAWLWFLFVQPTA